MWRTVLTTLYLRKPDTLCLVLGAEMFRYAIAGPEQPLHSEPATGNRWCDTKVIKAIGDERPTCHRWTEREWVKLFAGDIPVDAELLNRFCEGLQRRMSARPGGTTPLRLVATGRPNLMERVAPLLAEAARHSRFRSARVVAEGKCLARAVGDGGSDSLLVDVGHLGTRVYAGAGGQITGSEAAAGRAMRNAIFDIALHRHNLQIGELFALRMIQELDSPAKRPVHFTGRDLTTGKPRKEAMERDGVLEALSPTFAAMADVCERALSAANAAGGRVQRVVLAGGCAPSQELRRVVELRLRLPTISLENPAEASLRGLCALVQEGVE